MSKILRVSGDEIIVDEGRARPTPFHSPSEALQTHYDLLDWIDSEHGYNLTRDVILRHKTNYGVDEYGKEIPPTDPGMVEGYRSALWDTVNFNNTMYVSAHMCDQLQALIPSFEDEPLFFTDLPDDRGVVLFEAAIRSVMGGTDHAVIEDAEDPDDPLEYWIKGFAYRRVRNQVIEIDRNGVDLNIHIKSPPLDSGEEQDARIIAFEENDGIVVWPLFDAGEFFVAEGQWERNGRPPLLPMPFVAVPFGPRVPDPDGEDPTDLGQTRQLIVTLFRLIWQHILIEDTAFSRPERRRMNRIAEKYHKLPLDGEAIKIRHLRRLEGESTSEEREEREGHPLTYRIIVRGHPRDQHYPTLGPARIDGQWNPESHRKIWINAHIRGPEHAPLILKHSLDAVIR